MASLLRSCACFCKCGLQGLAWKLVIPTCCRKGRVLMARRSDLGVPAGFKQNANEVPDCDRSLFLKSPLSRPLGASLL